MILLVLFNNVEILLSASQVLLSVQLFLQPQAKILQNFTDDLSRHCVGYQRVLAIFFVFLNAIVFIY